MTDKTREALAPCPFCGSRNIQRADNGDYGAFWCICDDCGACTGEVGIHSQAEADARWNARAALAAEPAQPEARPVAIIPPPMVLDDNPKLSPLEYRQGWNACREYILRRVAAQARAMLNAPTQAEQGEKP